MTIELEKWLPIKGYERLYEVSSFGRLRNINGLLSPPKNKSGYVQAALYKKGKRKKFYVHVLVLKTFVREPAPGEECNHLNGKKADNKVSNLEWVTRSANHLHRYHVLGQKAVSGKQHFYYGKFGKNNPTAKTYIVTTPSGIEKTITGLNSFCKMVGLDVGTMSNIARNRYGYKAHKGWKCRYA